MDDSVTFGISVQSPTSSLQSELRVFSATTQGRLKPLLQNFTELGKLNCANVLPANVGNTSSAILSSMAPSWRIVNVPIKIPSISWFFAGYWHQWSCCRNPPMPKAAVLHLVLWETVKWDFLKILGGLRVGRDLLNLKQLYGALLLKENHTFWQNSLLEV